VGLLVERADGLTEGFLEGRADGFAEGFLEGRADGFAEGFFEGRTVGFFVGRLDGLVVGFFVGRVDGLADGFFVGRTEGFLVGRTDGLEEGFLDGILVGRELGLGRVGRTVGFFDLLKLGNAVWGLLGRDVGRFVGFFVGLDGFGTTGAFVGTRDGDVTHPSAIGLNPAESGVHLSLPSSAYLEVQHRAMHWELKEQNDQSDNNTAVFIGLLVGLAEEDDDATHPSAVGLNPAKSGVHLSLPSSAYLEVQQPAAH
jgi:hypothetical protein